MWGCRAGVSLWVRVSEDSVTLRCGAGHRGLDRHTLHTHAHADTQNTRAPQVTLEPRSDAYVLSHHKGLHPHRDVHTS